jgi:hypothetical protein
MAQRFFAVAEEDWLALGCLVMTNIAQIVVARRETCCGHIYPTRLTEESCLVESRLKRMLATKSCPRHVLIVAGVEAPVYALCTLRYTIHISNFG